MTYRDEAREFHQEARWTFWKFLPLFIMVLIALSAIGFALHSAGLLGRTVVEREVFKQSYQRSEAFKSRIATDEATLVEIEAKLRNPELDTSTRINLQAQAAAARARIDAARRQQ